MASFDKAFEKKTQFLVATMSTETVNIVAPELQGTLEALQEKTLRSILGRVWQRFFGNNIMSQLIAEFLFVCFLDNLVKAEKALLIWINKKTGQENPALTWHNIQAVNTIEEMDEDQFKQDFKKILAELDNRKLNALQKVIVWVLKKIGIQKK